MSSREISRLPLYVGIIQKLRRISIQHNDNTAISCDDGIANMTTFPCEFEHDISHTGRYYHIHSSGAEVEAVGRLVLSRAAVHGCGGLCEWLSVGLVTQVNFVVNMTSYPITHITNFV